MDITNYTATGRLVADPELRTTPAGNPVASGRLASTTRNDGTLFVNLTAWGKTAEILVEYCGKGSAIAVSGVLDREDNWTDREGKEREGSLRLTIDALKLPPKSDATPAKADEDIDF